MELHLSSFSSPFPPPDFSRVAPMQKFSSLFLPPSLSNACVPHTPLCPYSDGGGATRAYCTLVCAAARTPDCHPDTRAEESGALVGTFTRMSFERRKRLTMERLPDEILERIAQSMRERDAASLLLVCKSLLASLNVHVMGRLAAAQMDVGFFQASLAIRRRVQPRQLAKLLGASSTLSTLDLLDGADVLQRFFWTAAQDDSVLRSLR